MKRPGLIIPIPVSPIDKLAERLRSHLHLPDPDPLYALCGAVAANIIEGPPVWIMFIGAPGCGKSELLNSLLGVPHVVEAADIAGDSAFLSATSTRDWADDATGGILRQIGDHGALILNDFTSVLSKRQDSIAQIMAIFRECYGGRWTRHVGADGGRPLKWIGKMAVLAGVTGVIDHQHRLSAELGERWMYYRFATRETFADTSLALSNEREGWRAQVRDSMREFFESQDLRFGAPRPRRDFSESERLRLYELASFAVRCRSSVSRDSYTHEVIAPRETEFPTRLACALAQLLVGMDAIGVAEKSRWRVLQKVALDSMPRLRRMAIEAAFEEPVNVTRLSSILGCSATVARRVVEDLEIHEVVRREKRKVHMTEWALDMWRRFL